jgi:hypothetical protein
VGEEESAITQFLDNLVRLNSMLSEKASMLSHHTDVSATAVRLEFTNYSSSGRSVEGLVEAFLKGGGGLIWAITLRRTLESGWNLERTLEVTGEDRGIVKELEVVRWPDTASMSQLLEPSARELLAIDGEPWLGKSEVSPTGV